MIETLPLTPFEELMLYQDSSAYPCTCFIRLRFEGRLAQPAFEAAARGALGRHPLLAARVDQSRRRPCWILDAEPAPEIVWREGDVDDQYSPTRYLDLGEARLRLWVTRSSSASELLVQFHHACCDGLGIFQFIQDLLVLYARECGVSLPDKALPTLQPQRLAERGTFGLSTWKLFKMLPRQAVGLAGVRQFLSRKPVPTIPHERRDAGEPTAEPYPAACGQQLDAPTVDGLRGVAKKLQVTTNDLLARDLFLALQQYRTRREMADDDAWLRMMIPMSLRSAADRYTPAANIVSSVFLDRRGVDCADAQQLLASIRDEMEVIKRNRLGFTFVFSLHVHRWLPGGIRNAARGDRCNTSAVFTNLGKLFSRTSLPREGSELVCGDVRLIDVQILAPLTPYTCTAFSAGWYADRLSLALHYDPRVLGAADGRELLELFAAQVRHTAGSCAEVVV